jgi:hypothetical protein
VHACVPGLSRPSLAAAAATRRTALLFDTECDGDSGVGRLGVDDGGGRRGAGETGGGAPRPLRPAQSRASASRRRARPRRGRVPVTRPVLGSGPLAPRRRRSPHPAGCPPATAAVHPRFVRSFVFHAPTILLCPASRAQPSAFSVDRLTVRGSSGTFVCRVLDREEEACWRRVRAEGREAEEESGDGAAAGRDEGQGGDGHRARRAVPGEDPRRQAGACSPLGPVYRDREERGGQSTVEKKGGGGKENQIAFSDENGFFWLPFAVRVLALLMGKWESFLWLVDSALRLFARFFLLAVKYLQIWLNCMNLEACRGLILNGECTLLVEPCNSTDSIDTASRRGQCAREFVDCCPSLQQQRIPWPA